MGRTPAGETREKVFAFVRDRLLAGQPPTVREVQEAHGFRAVRTAQQHLERLVEDGRLVAGRPRARDGGVLHRHPGGAIASQSRLVVEPGGAHHLGVGRLSDRLLGRDDVGHIGVDVQMRRHRGLRHPRAQFDFHSSRKRGI